jgi:hypothetical protein
MAITTLPCIGAQAPDFQDTRFHYALLREQMAETAAVAHALGMHQEPDTFAYHLSCLLDSRMADADLWNKLDKFFEVDSRGAFIAAVTNDLVNGAGNE